MVRLLAVVTLVGLLSKATSAAEIASGHQARIGVDVAYADTDAYSSWTDGSAGKLRHGASGAVLNRLFVDYSGRWADTLNAHVVVDGYDDELGNALDVTQAYLEWRPIPYSGTRYRIKLGAFYPGVSLENVTHAWSSPYTLSSSAINTWIAEELRTLGAELSVSKRPASLAGLHTFSLEAGAFRGNDPAGSLLAWRGWSLHDRQSRRSDKLPLPPLPQIQPGTRFEKQDSYVAPFREIDGRVGYYLNGEWRNGDKWTLKFGHYDNRADPLRIENGQYAWRTRFNHFGLQSRLPGGMDLVLQWMSGGTAMGPVESAGGPHAVDAEYASYFGLLSKSIGRHRLTFRYDDFEVAQTDQTPADDNAEQGHALTLAYQQTLGDVLGFAVECLRIRTHRFAMTYYGLPQAATETQCQLALRIRL
jgi:hypothetical protein